MAECCGPCRTGVPRCKVTSRMRRDARAKAIVKKPMAVYIEKIYEEDDFSQLEIGA